MKMKHMKNCIYDETIPGDEHMKDKKPSKPAWIYVTVVITTALQHTLNHYHNHYRKNWNITE